jgi:DNA repair protein RecN (Recombination protein N)
MILELKITNLAIIDTLQLTFTKGLNVLTGETGAGKSIILQAINLLFGGKASASAVRTGATETTIEALFEVPSTQTPVLKLLADRGFDTDAFLIIKRILTKQGRSRYYVNNSLATARQVAELSNYLITVAGQRDHQQLLDPTLHLDFIDAINNLWPQRLKFTDLFNQWSELQKKLNNLRQKEQEKEQRRDFLTFQCREIQEAGLQLGEDEILAAEKKLLKSADALARLCSESLNLLNEAVVDGLAQARKNLEQAASLDESLGTLANDVADNYYQLADHADRLQEYYQAIPNDCSRLEEIDARLDLLQRLKRKYADQEMSLAEVLAHAGKCAQELQQLDDLEQELQLLQQQIAAIEQILPAKAAELSRQRRESASRFTRRMQKQLLSLSFDQAEFEVTFKACEENLQSLDATGWDRAEFMFSANPGVPLKPLAHIISGGELSRLMLAFKCVMAQKDMVETVLFDEVDAGIGGQAAEAVAGKIKELANHHQVLCITHLPQIATYAYSHYLVTKKVTDKSTRLSITLLSKEQRTRELARMLAGKSITAKTLSFAEELAGRK